LVYLRVGESGALAGSGRTEHPLFQRIMASKQTAARGCKLRRVEVLPFRFGAREDMRPMLGLTLGGFQPFVPDGYADGFGIERMS